MKIVHVLVIFCAIVAGTAAAAAAAAAAHLQSLLRSSNQQADESGAESPAGAKTPWITVQSFLFESPGRILQDEEKVKKKKKKKDKSERRSLLEWMSSTLSFLSSETPDEKTMIDEVSERNLQDEEEPKEKKKKKKKEKGKRNLLEWMSSTLSFLISETPMEKAMISSESNLKPLEISPAKFSDNGKQVAPNAYVMGLDQNVRTTLLEYCNRVGITDHFQDLLMNGNELQSDSSKTEVFDDFDWTVQRPEEDGLWNNNMHWISPSNAASYEEFLKVLGDAGFDAVMETMGQTFGLEKLGIYQLSFHGISKAAEEGFYHVDFEDTGNKTWNVIVPLVLAKETGPEIGIVHQDVDSYKKRLGLYRYEQDVALLLGDGAEHVTAQCDYHGQDMRMVAIIYMAEVDESNVDNVISSYYGAPYPPHGNVETLQSLVHWGNGKALPTH